MKTQNTFWNRWRDTIIAALVFIVTFALYLRTLAPSVAFLFDDTLEYQYVIPRLGIIHPTGYPFFTLLGKLFTLCVPLNDPAFRLNLLSALAGALAVAMLYLVACHLPIHRIAAIIGALTFAMGQTFWAQAVIAESYTMQMLLIAVLLYIVLIWCEQVQWHNEPNARRWFFALAFVMGLGLTHHRLIVLLYPAIAIYIILVNRSILRDFKTIARAAIFFLLPLSFYLYLPLRGNIGSADGTYENTFAGFTAWVMAQQYTVFLTSNPLAVQHNAQFYWTLFSDQFGIFGLALAAVGVIGLLRRSREWVLLTIALLVEVGFAFNYRTANVYVHFLTPFLLLALFVGAGMDFLLDLLARLVPRPSQLAIRNSIFASLFLLALLVPSNLVNSNYALNDLSQKWDMSDYGRDILSQPLEDNATVIGILGEMTLLRYLQDNANMRTDVQTIVANDEKLRLAAIDNALKQNRSVYLTRSLKGAPEKYSLSSLGPLIRVQPKPATTAPQISHPRDDDFGAVKLLGYDVDASRLDAIPSMWHIENGKQLRVTLYWQAMEKIATDAMVSIKIVRSDQRVFGQTDHRPVLDAYPTTAWREGEIIADTYAVPLFLGVTPSDYQITVTMYDAHSNAVIGQHELQKIALGVDTLAPRRNKLNIVHSSAEYFALSLAGYAPDVWNMAQTTNADFGTLSLAGYSLDNNVWVRPGDALPITVLWHAGAQKLPDNLVARIWLEDASGKNISSRDAPISVGYPPFLWAANVYVRDWLPVRIPANIPDGRYVVKLAIARGNQLLGAMPTPFSPTVVDLGRVEIKNRERVMSLPKISTALEATFDQKMKFLGYDVQMDAEQHTARLTLHWRALAQMDTAYTVFVHLLDAKNNVIASGDAPPGNGALPTTGWIEDEYVSDAHTFALTDVPPGSYPIEIGVYDPTTGLRLKMADGQDRLILAAIAIK